MQPKLGAMFSAKNFLFPRKNHWLTRTILVFAFILFDYASTLVFCRAPHEEANLYARAFMETLGVPLGLTLFVLAINLPVYITLSLDSHIVRLPSRVAKIIEPFVDTVFAWFVAGSHFGGGVSWFWHVSNVTAQALGAFIYLTIAFLLIKPHRPDFGSGSWLVRNNS